MHLTPAEFIILRFGGVCATARQLGYTHAAVVKWKSPPENGGCGGFVPFKAQRVILQIAVEQGLDIVPADFHYGREIP